MTTSVNTRNYLAAKQEYCNAFKCWGAGVSAGLCAGAVVGVGVGIIALLIAGPVIGLIAGLVAGGIVAFIALAVVSAAYGDKIDAMVELMKKSK